MLPPLDDAPDALEDADAEAELATEAAALPVRPAGAARPVVVAVALLPAAPLAAASRTPVRLLEGRWLSLGAAPGAPFKAVAAEEGADEEDAGAEAFADAGG